MLFRSPPRSTHSSTLFPYTTLFRSWDTAAGILIVTEAGGKVTDLRGGFYSPGGPDLLVTNGHIHAEMQQMMAEIATRANSKL